MKKIKVSMLALSFLAGGMLAASAATTITYRAYNMSANYTNADAKIWFVNGGPETVPGALYPQFVYYYGSIDTDGSGKISGVGAWEVSYSTNATPYSVVWGTISGKLAGKIGSPSSVTMTIKADGYTADGVGFAVPFSGNLKFTGQPGVNPANTNSQAMVGTVTGTVKGSTPLDPKGYKIPSGRVAFINNSGFEYANLSADVLQSSKGKMQFFSTSVQGTGTIKNDATYKAAAKGIGFEKGISVSFSGTMGLYTNVIGTNVVPFLAPKSADIAKTSKVFGQAIQGAVSSINAQLRY